MYIICYNVYNESNKGDDIMVAVSETVKYLDLFFEEKDIVFTIFEIEKDDMTHFVESDFVIELIKNASEQEQRSIVHQLRRIDFANADVLHFLKFLANAYIQSNY